MTTPNPPRTAETVAGELRSNSLVIWHDGEPINGLATRELCDEAADHLDRLSREVADGWKKDAEIAGLHVSVEWWQREHASLQVQVEALSGVITCLCPCLEGLAGAMDLRGFANTAAAIREDIRLARAALSPPVRGGE